MVPPKSGLYKLPVSTTLVNLLDEAICYDPTLINFLKFQPFSIISAFFAGLGIRQGFGKLSTASTSLFCSVHSPGIDFDLPIGLAVL
jgi:hypothetical protein